MIKMSHIVAALVFVSISVVQAEAANEPVSQGATSINKNMDNDPDDKGLYKASEQMKENETKVTEKRATAVKKSSDAMRKKDSYEHMEKPGHDKVERADKMGRPGM